MIGGAAVVRRSAIAKQTADMCTSPISQAIAAHYLASGRYDAMVGAARAEYGRRALAMADALRAALGDDIRFDAPKGGLFLWAESRVRLDPEAFFKAAVSQGVLFVPGAAFLPTAQALATSLRLSFAAPVIDDVREGVRRLARAWRTAAGASVPASSTSLLTA
jgi:DNA-binding transcriptional MocR family regulator